MTGKVAAIVLAAGFSSRMGEFKPLLQLGGATVLERAVTLFREVGIADVRVVTGHRAEELEPFLARLEVHSVENPHYRDGMFSSVAAGAATIEPEVDGFFVLPVDVPLVRSGTVRRLFDKWRQGDWDVVYPCFLGERGHPPFIAGRRAQEIAGWEGDGGLRGALAQWESDALEVAVADETILCDMDTPDDYRRLLERYEHRQVPTEMECRVLLNEVLRVEPHIVSHGQAVRETAVQLAKELNRAGCRMDVPLLASAGLLHDIARKEHDHARTGARLLREMGYGAVADLVATHMEITVPEGESVGAAEVLYLADKLVQGAQRVTLTERFGATMERHCHEPAIIERIADRLKTAIIIQKRLEAVLGRSMSEVIDTV